MVLKKETQKRERCARREAWDFAKQAYRIRGSLEQNRATFFSPSLDWCLPAPSTIKQEEREIVVDSGASTHMLWQKDLISAEWDAVRVSRLFTTVITARWSVEKNEEATVYVLDWDLFVTVQLLKDTPPVLSLG